MGGLGRGEARWILVCGVAAAALVGAVAGGCSSDSSGGSPDAGLPDVTTGPDGANDSAPSDDASDAGSDANADAPVPFDCTKEVSAVGDGGTFELPHDLRCTGLYSDWATLTVASDVRAFTPGYVLYSDGAMKSRWVFLPPGKKIDATDPNEWSFPVGTKFWKEFVVAGRRVETRLFQKISPSDWAKTTYVWSADLSSATRLDNGSGGPPDDAGLIDDGGVTGGLDGAAAYEIPSVQKCDVCHFGRQDKILGFEAVSLGAPNALGVTLAVLKSEGLLVTSDGGVSTLPSTLTIPDDGTGKGADAIGWLHANCGTICHNANPNAECHFLSMRLRVEVEELTSPEAGVPSLTALQAYTTTHDVAASSGLGDPAFKPYMRIAHGNPSKSLVRYLVGRRTTTETYGQMPPLDTHVVDVDDLANLDAWITAMP